MLTLPPSPKETRVQGCDFELMMIDWLPKGPRVRGHFWPHYPYDTPPFCVLIIIQLWFELSILSSKSTKNRKLFWISNTQRMQKVHLHGRYSNVSNVWVIKVDIVSDFVSDTVTGIADGVHGMLNFATGRHPLPCCHGRSWGDSDRFPKNSWGPTNMKKTWNKIRIKNQVHKFKKKPRLRENGCIQIPNAFQIPMDMVLKFNDFQIPIGDHCFLFFFRQTPEATGSEETSAPRGAVQETHLVTWAKVAKEFFWALGSFKSKVENLWKLGRVWFFSLVDNYLDSYFDFQQFSTMGWNVRSLVNFILHQTNPIRFVCWCCSLRFSWVAPISCVDTCFETRPAIAHIYIYIYTYFRDTWPNSEKPERQRVLVTNLQLSSLQDRSK